MSNLTALSALSVIIDEDPITSFELVDNSVKFIHLSGAQSDLIRIKGEDGSNGADGIAGKDGNDGVGIASFSEKESNDSHTIYDLALSNGEHHQLQVNHGKDGTGISDIVKTKSRANADFYNITLSDGRVFEFKVTNGKDGKDGVDGNPGLDGKDGKDGLSAYDIAVKNGFEGDETQWLNSLIGRDGKSGQSVIGERGTGVSSAAVNNAGELLIGLTDGRVLNAGTIASPTESLKGPLLEYTGGKLTSVTYDNGSVKTLIYTGDKLTEVRYSTGSRVEVKTLVYAGDVLIEVIETVE
jgi:hypothetical protein